MIIKKSTGNNKIDIIIPNYNGADIMKKNLPLLLSIIKNMNEISIIIVDDASIREDFEELERYLKKIKYKYHTPISLVRNDKNLGFSGTVNQGVSISHAEFVVMLNSDVVPEEYFIQKALPYLLDDENLFGVGFLEKSFEAGKTILRGRGLGFWKRGVLIHSRGEVNKTSTFWISGGSSLIRRSLFEELGGFDELYSPFYWEDIDLSYRAQKMGYSLLFGKESVISHYHNEGAIKKHYSMKDVTRVAYRNQFIFIWKNISDFNLLLSHIIWLPYHIGKALWRRDWEFILGFIFAFILLPSIIKKKKEQSRYNVKKDKELFLYQ